MKTVFALAVSLLFLVGCVPPAAAQSTAYANVDTPTAHHLFTGCTFDDLFVARVGTNVTVYADCTNHTAQPQVKGWSPTDHPDGGVLWWDSQFRFSESAVFIQCTMLAYDHTSGFDLLFVQCLDDPFPPPVVTRRK